jgi:nucleoside-diphosphate-sugar epimerase
MNILITGAAGFLGRHLANNLPEHTVTALTRSQLDLSQGPLVRSYLKNNQFDWIINCAVAGRDCTLSTDPSMVSDNLIAFTNLYASLDLVSGMINFGSGAEFDIEQPIDCAPESLIWQRQPKTSYGLSKNLMAKLCSQHAKCHNLRIFGCFDHSEDERRPIKKLSNMLSQNRAFVIDQDRWFDMFSLNDVTTVVRCVLTSTCQFRDINLVYDRKTRLSDILRLYCTLHGYDPDYIHVRAQDGLSYTGDSSRLASLALPLLGLTGSLDLYGKILSGNVGSN